MQKSRDPKIRFERVPRKRAAPVRVGGYEFKKEGISRFDLRDPYHLAIALTWPQFLGALLALYLLVNLGFATIFWLVPGSVANVRPDSFADALFFSIETLATVGYGDMHPATLYGHVAASTEIVCAAATLNVLLSERAANGKPFRRAQELRLELAHIPLFPLFWTLMHVLDEGSLPFNCSGSDPKRTGGVIPNV